MTSLRFAVLALAVACGGDSPDEEDENPDVPTGSDDPPTEDTSPREDTGGPGEQPKEVMEYSLGGWFGYDATTGTTVPTLTDGDTFPSYFYLEFRSTEYQGECDDEVCCYVYIAIDGYTGETFATTDGFAFGFHVPQATATGFTTCIDNGFDPEDPAWGGQDPFVAWSDAALGWGLAIGGVPSTTVTEWTGADDPYGYVIGGELVSAGLDAADTLYFLAWATDPSMEILEDQPRDRLSIVDGYGALTTGYYQFDVMVHF